MARNASIGALAEWCGEGDGGLCAGGRGTSEQGSGAGGQLSSR